eukprot:9171178-Pyramimonas_sp.AAC.1
MPCSTRPVTTVPRPVMEKTSSTLREKGLSSARSGAGMCLSHASISAITASLPILSSLPCRKNGGESNASMVKGRSEGCMRVPHAFVSAVTAPLPNLSSSPRKTKPPRSRVCSASYKLR